MSLITDVKFEVWWRRNKTLLLSPMGRKAVSESINLGAIDTSWYQRNGYESIARALGGGMSSAGVVVNSDKALGVAAWYAGVKVIAEDMGTMPFVLYERASDRKSVEPMYSDRRYSLLKNMANPDTSAGEFSETLTSHALMLGNGYAYIERFNDSDKPAWLWPLMPNEVRIEQGKDRRNVYLTKYTGTEKETPRKSIFHLKGLSFQGSVGDDLMLRAKSVLGLSIAAQDYASMWFKNDATPGTVIGFPAGIRMDADAVRRFKIAWKEWFQGVANSHEPAVLADGGEVKNLYPDNDKTQLIEQRRFQILEVCRLLRISPHKLADLDRATFSNIEQLAIEYLTTTIGPWRRRWKEAFFRCLLTRDEQLQDRLYAEHNVESFLRGDFKAQAEAFAKLLEKGVYSINEVRRWLNLNPVADGDSHYVQLNRTAVADAATEAAKNQGLLAA